MIVTIYKPCCICGCMAETTPLYFEANFASFIGFESAEECDKWIENNLDKFTSTEVYSGIKPNAYQVENPTIINANEDVLRIYGEENDDNHANFDYTELETSDLMQTVIEECSAEEILEIVEGYVGEDGMRAFCLACLK